MWQTQGYWTAQHGINLTSPCHTPLKLSCLPRQDSQVRPSRPPQAVYTAFPELAVRLKPTTAKAEQGHYPGISCAGQEETATLLESYNIWTMSPPKSQHQGEVRSNTHEEHNLNLFLPHQCVLKESWELFLYYFQPHFSSCLAATWWLTVMPLVLLAFTETQKPWELLNYRVVFITGKMNSIFLGVNRKLTWTN